MPIIWKKAMSVGNDLIDHDHHFMVNFLNTIELLLQSPNHKEMLIEAFNQLYEYSVNHFRREESLQRKIEYPRSIQHKNEHKNLLKDLDNLRLTIKSFETV